MKFKKMKNRTTKAIKKLTIIVCILLLTFLFLSIISLPIINKCNQLIIEKSNIITADFSRSDHVGGIGQYPHEVTYGFWDKLFVATIILIEIIIFFIVPLVIIGIIIVNIIAIIGLIIFAIIKKVKKRRNKH